MPICAVTAIGGLVIARTVAGAVTLSAILRPYAGNAGLIVGLHMANNISTAFAIRLVARWKPHNQTGNIGHGGIPFALMLVGGLWCWP